MRNLILPVASMAASVAFQMSIDAGYLRNWEWAVPWLWACCAALWALWMIGHDRVTKGWFRPFHEKAGNAIWVIRALVAALVFVCALGLALRLLKSKTALASGQSPNSQQSAEVKGNDNTTGNIQQNGSGNTAIVGNNNSVRSTFNQGKQLSGWLRPGGASTPSVSCLQTNTENHVVRAAAEPIQIPLGEYALFFGGSVALFKDFPVTVLQVADTPRLILEKDKSGRIALTLDIFDSEPNPRIIAAIEHGKFTVNPNNYFKFEKSAKGDRLEIIDQHNTEVLDVKYINPRAISVNAILYYPKMRGPLVITDSEIDLNGQHIYHNCFGPAAPKIIAIDPQNPHAISGFALTIFSNFSKQP